MPPKNQPKAWYLLKTDEKVSGIYSRKVTHRTANRGTILCTVGSSNTGSTVNVHSSEEDWNFQCKKSNLEHLTNKDKQWLVAVSDTSDRYSLYKDDVRWKNRLLMVKGQRVKVKKPEYDQWVSGIIKTVGELKDKKGTWINVEINNKVNTLLITSFLIICKFNNYDIIITS